MYATDVRQHHRLMPHGQGYNNIMNLCVNLSLHLNLTSLKQFISSFEIHYNENTYLEHNVFGFPDHLVSLSFCLRLTNSGM